MNYGFVRVAAAVPKLRVADCDYNADNIINIIHKAEFLKVQFIVFPELSITAYTCGDLFHQVQLQNEAIRQLEIILEKTSCVGAVAIIGLPLSIDNQLFNCGVAIQYGQILGIVPKTFIPGYSEFYVWEISNLFILDRLNTSINSSLKLNTFRNLIWRGGEEHEQVA